MSFQNFSLFHSLLSKIGQNFLDYFWKKTMRTSGGSRISQRGRQLIIWPKLAENCMKKLDRGRAFPKFYYVDPPPRTEYRFDDRTDLEKQFLSGRFVLVSRRLHALVHRLLQLVLDHSDVLVCALTSSLSVRKLKTSH